MVLSTAILWLVTVSIAHYIWYRDFTEDSERWERHSIVLRLDDNIHRGLWHTQGNSMPRWTNPWFHRGIAPWHPYICDGVSRNDNNDNFCDRALQLSRWSLNQSTSFFFDRHHLGLSSRSHLSLNLHSPFAAIDVVLVYRDGCLFKLSLKFSPSVDPCGG